VTANVPAETPIGASWAWFSAADVRYGVTDEGTLPTFCRRTLAVFVDFIEFTSTMTDPPVAERTAFTRSAASVDVAPTTIEPGRMKRLKLPMV
jgi:hypothetical protein